MTLMLVFLGIAQVAWLAATAFVRSRGYSGNYAMKTGVTQRNETWSSLKVLSSDGRPEDRRKAKAYCLVMVGSYLAGFSFFIVMLRNL